MVGRKREGRTTLLELQDKHESLLAIEESRLLNLKKAKNLIFYDIIPGRKMEIKNRGSYCTIQ